MCEIYVSCILIGFSSAVCGILDSCSLLGWIIAMHTLVWLLKGGTEKYGQLIIKNTACYSSAIPVRLWTLRLQALVFQLQELSLFRILCSKSSKHVDWTNGQSLKPPKQFKRAWCLILHRDSFHWICTLCRICRPFLHWVWVFSKPLSIVRVIATGDVAESVKLGWGGIRVPVCGLVWTSETSETSGLVRLVD